MLVKIKTTFSRNFKLNPKYFRGEYFRKGVYHREPFKLVEQIFRMKIFAFQIFWGETGLRT